MAVLVGLALLVTVAAQADDTDVAAVAALAGVDAQDLAGAVNTTGLPAHDYLVMTGELAPPYPPRVPYVWDALAQCESSGIWSRNTGNGYYGGLQEDLRFWANYGGPAYASRPDLAPKAAQIAVAATGQAHEGWKAWPVCSRQLRLR